MALRVLHTADWHLGQTFHAFDRDYEHARFLAWLLDVLTERRPDALLIAGDVFDNINPSASAQRHYYGFLAEARRRLPALQVVVTAGNHDAAARLEAPAAMLEAFGITVVGTVGKDGAGVLDLDRFIVPLRDAAGQVAALALAVPFLRPADVPAAPAATDPYLGGIRELYRQVIARAEALRRESHPDCALIALGHLHLQGAVESRDSERRVVIGGAEALGADLFPPTLAYVALGHLHQPQGFEGGRIQYSGSPIPLSFSERTYPHRVVELAFSQGALIGTESWRVPRAVSLLRLPESHAASVEELADRIVRLELAETAPEAQPFLEVHVREDRPNPELRRQIEQMLAGRPVRLAAIRRVSGITGQGAVAGALAAAADLNALQPEELMTEHHRERFGTDPDPAVLQAMRQIVLETP